MKQVLIINGYPTCGKTTFERIMLEYCKGEYFSSITPINEILLNIGWDGITKDTLYRNTASDLKDLLTKFNDYSYKKVCEKINGFLQNEDKEILMIDIREPEEIQKIVDTYPEIITVFIQNDKPINKTNHADMNVVNYIYDYYIDNNSTINELKYNIKVFLNELKLLKELKDL